MLGAANPLLTKTYPQPYPMHFLNIHFEGIGEISWWLGELAALSGDPDSVPSTNMAAHKYL